MMTQNRQYSFTHSSGEDIYLFTLQNNNGTLVSISNYGAIINSYIIKDQEDTDNDIVLGFEDIESYTDEDYLKNYSWFGAAIGRYANRIKNGNMNINGIDYPLSKNKGKDQLHGGWEGFDKKVWKVALHTETTLKLIYISPDGEEGFPGNLEVTLLFTLNEKDELSYEFTAVTDMPTAINLTHHSYFNLNNGKGPIADHYLKIYSKQILSQDKNLVADGNILSTAGTPCDFSKWKKINAEWDVDNGYDQSYVISKKDNEFALVAEVFSDHNKLKLQLFSTEPVVHFYSGRWVPTLEGKNNTLYGPYAGLCLETQVHPNAINIPHFPNTILLPGEKYYHKTVYKPLYAEMK